MKATDRFKEGLTDAWNFARMYAAVKSKKGLPALSKVLDEVDNAQKAKTRTQSAAELKATVEYLSQMSGIPMRRKGEKRGK